MAAATHICAGCGEPFLASRSHARICSDRCRMRIKRARAHGSPTPEVWMLVEAAGVLEVRAHTLHPLDAVLRVAHAIAHPDAITVDPSRARELLEAAA